MSENNVFTVDPWKLREVAFDIDVLPQAETLFALANGHIGMRGTLDEGEPHGLPGSYLNSVYEKRPLPHAEAAYGNPESSETVINVTDGKLFRLLVEDEPFDIRYGELLEHERELDFRDGVLRRNVMWRSPAGQTVRVHSERIVSLTQRSIAAIKYEVEAVDKELRIVVQSELVANEQMPGESKDPRTAAVLHKPLVAEDQSCTGTFVSLTHTTRESGLRVSAAMDHSIEGPSATLVSSDVNHDTGRVTITTVLQPGERLQVLKFLGYGWSSARSLPALRDQVAAALTMAKHTGWTNLLEEQANYLRDYWDNSDVVIDGDAELQQAIRLGLFHIMQCTARAERRAIPAKGLSGPGYDGHAFWDMETFLLQVLTYTHPAAAADTLRWRHSILPMARERAQQLGFKGALFPWRTIAGEECSGYWPAGTAAFHIDADIADAVIRYLDVTQDEQFERSIGLELLVETARFWRSVGQFDLTGKFRIDGVTGPDEYSSIADNNVYTNLMAQRNLWAAADVAAKHNDHAQAMGVSNEDIAAWRSAADAMYVPFDEARGIHPQSENFTNHEVWDFANTPDEKYPLLLHYPYLDLYRKQVVKQADLVLAMQMRPDVFSDEQMRKNFEYYEAITVRDSSLSACTQAVMAAWCGHLDLAYDYLGESALVDLHDLAGNTRDGLHMASLAGSWAILTIGFGGMVLSDGVLTFKPRLPHDLNRVGFNVNMRGRLLRVEITKETVTYRNESAEPIEIGHYDELVTLECGNPVTRKLPVLPSLPRPRQPERKEPVVRSSRPQSYSDVVGDAASK